jgi:hypothetical protein
VWSCFSYTKSRLKKKKGKEKNDPSVKWGLLGGLKPEGEEGWKKRVKGAECDQSTLLICISENSIMENIKNYF